MPLSDVAQLCGYWGSLESPDRLFPVEREYAFRAKLDRMEECALREIALMVKRAKAAIRKGAK